MFIVALFTVVKKLKTTHVHQWIKRNWYIHTMKYYSAIKRNEVLIHTTMWMNLINTDLSKRSQTQKVTCYDSIYLTYIKSVNP